MSNTNTRVQEMIAHLNGLPDAALGFSAKKFYETGAAYKVTCREILTNFLGKSKAVGRGRYLAVAPADFQASRKEKAPKAIKQVVVKVKKEAAAKTPAPAKKAPKTEVKAAAKKPAKKEVTPAKKAPKGAATKAVVTQPRVNGRFVKATPAA